MEQLNPTAIETELFELINKARTEPKTFAPALRERYQTFKDKMWKKGDKWFNSREGDVAVREAFEFLEEQKPLQPLKLSEPLRRAAKQHQEDLTKSGKNGHTGSDGSTLATRIEQQGRWKGGVSENLAYQQFTALDFLLYWIVNDGVTNRADRKNLFNQNFGICGLAVGSHPTLKSVVVLVIAGEITEGASGKEATRLLNEYEKAGHDQFGVNGQILNFGDMQKTLQADMAGDLKKDWIPGAVSMRTEKAIIKDGDKEKTKFTFIYTMGDGSLQTREEEFDGIVENK